MRISKTSRGYVMRLDPGEPLVDALLAWARKEAPPAAEVRGIGALKDSEIGYFDLATKSYRTVLLPESMELLQLQGNLAWVDGSDGGPREPALHAHVVLAGPEMVARGGHLVSAVVSVTAELFVEPLSPTLRRAPDEASGLKLLDL